MAQTAQNRLRNCGFQSNRNGAERTVADLISPHGWPGHAASDDRQKSGLRPSAAHRYRQADRSLTSRPPFQLRPRLLVYLAVFFLRPIVTVRVPRSACAHYPSIVARRTPVPAPDVRATTEIQPDVMLENHIAKDLRHGLSTLTGRPAHHVRFLIAHSLRMTGTANAVARSIVGNCQLRHERSWSRIS